ncbi:MAG: MFS transporter, partial [Candidatus Hodarchaeota archaeon]
MEPKHTFNILLLLVFYSSACIGILLPMGDVIAEILPGIHTEAQIIFISSIFLMVGAGTSFIWAFLAAKISRRKLLIVATLIWSVAMLITPISRDFLSLLLFQIFTAIGFGAVLPLTYSMIVDLFDIEKRGHAFGLKETFYVLGVGAAQILSGFMIDLYPWYVP